MAEQSEEQQMKPRDLKKVFRRNMMKFFSGAAVAVVLLFAAAAAFSCEMHFSLQREGETIELSSRDETVLALGGSYTMNVTFIEDHRRCLVPPEETVYLMEYERWDENKAQPLRVLEQGSWEEISSGTWKQEVLFEATQAGNWVLEVIRDCPRGGFNQILSFEVR
jgi:hypothetical protein